MIARVVRQRTDHDCSVAAVAMLCSVPYEDAAAEMRKVAPKAFTRGAYMHEMEKVAKALGHKTKRRRPFVAERDADTARGVVYVEYAKQDHAAFLAHGLILDPDGAEVWHWREYTRERGCKLTELLELVP